jgi:hypothetical protein
MYWEFYRETSLGTYLEPLASDSLRVSNDYLLKAREAMRRLANTTLTGTLVGSRQRISIRRHSNNKFRTLKDSGQHDENE